jgi:hypothetical protein
VSADTLIPLLFIGVPALLIWIWALVDAVRNAELSGLARVAWIAAVLVLPGVGALAYIAIPGRARLFPR